MSHIECFCWLVAQTCTLAWDMIIDPKVWRKPSSFSLYLSLLFTLGKNPTSLCHKTLCQTYHGTKTCLLPSSHHHSITSIAGNCNLHRPRLHCLESIFFIYCVRVCFKLQKDCRVFIKWQASSIAFHVIILNSFISLPCELKNGMRAEISCEHSIIAKTQPYRSKHAVKKSMLNFRDRNLLPLSIIFKNNSSIF